MQPYDIGSGEATSILDLAKITAAHYGAPDPQINGKFRDGDVRHASCTIEESAAALDWAAAGDGRGGGQATVPVDRREPELTEEAATGSDSWSGRGPVWPVATG